MNETTPHSPPHFESDERLLAEELAVDLQQLRSFSEILSQDPLRSLSESTQLPSDSKLEDLDGKDLRHWGAPERRARWRELGEQAIRKGHIAVVVLTGGMATRFGGAVKAEVPAAFGRSFLQLKLADAERAARKHKVRIPFVMMTSFNTDARVRQLLERSRVDLVDTFAFQQFASFRLNRDGSLFRDAEGKLSPYATGHGDFSQSLIETGMLQTLEDRGIRYLLLSNVDNVGATLDAEVLGAHIEEGCECSAEVVKKLGNDRGGAAAVLNGKEQIVEAFRLPAGFDANDLTHFNTNTFVLNLQARKKSFPLHYFAVEKNVDGKPVVQFERLVGELTAFLQTSFLVVPRSGEWTRFLPVKELKALDELKDELEAAVSARGLKPTE